MTRFRQILNRLGGPAAVSWATFWSSLAFNIYVTFWGSFTPTADARDRIIAVLVSQTTMWGFLLLCRATVLASTTTRRRPVVAIACFAVAGVIRSFTVGVLYATVLGVGPIAIPPRIFAGVIFGLVAFVPVALIANAVGEYRRIRADLLTTRVRLLASGQALVKEMEAKDDHVTERIRASIMESLSEVERSGDIGELDRLAVEVVRPLSHELAQTVPPWQPPPVQAASVRVLVVLDQAFRGGPLMPITTTAVILLVAIVPLWLNTTSLLSIVYFVGALAVCLAALLAANRVLPRLLHDRAGWGRVLLLIATLSVVGLMVGGIAELGLGTGQLRLPWMESVWFLTVLTGLALAIARAAVRELESTLAELRQADDQLAWQVTRLRMVQWVQSKRLARALHGPVQGAISASTARLKGGAESDALVIGELRHALLEALSSNRERRTFLQAVELVRANWLGLCEVALVDECDEGGRLSDDDAACEIAIDIVTEAVSNAIRHGRAQHVTVMARCEADRVTLVVADDGFSATQAGPGLGTQLLHDCTLAWSREAISGSTILKAVLPLERCD